jgi:hypothetical protein
MLCAAIVAFLSALCAMIIITGSPENDAPTMPRNLGGAVGTATLGTVLTKREQFHSNIVRQSITLGREEVRARLDQMTDYFMWRLRPHQGGQSVDRGIG